MRPPARFIPYGLVMFGALLASEVASGDSTQRWGLAIFFLVVALVAWLVWRVRASRD